MIKVLAFNNFGIADIICIFSFFPGWLFKVQLSEPKELDQLLSEKQYETFIKESKDH